MCSLTRIFMFSTMLVLASACAKKIKTETKTTEWNDLRITWGPDPFNPNYFAAMPLTENDAVTQGWKKEKDCSQVNGIRYIKDNDQSVMIIYDKNGQLAGIATTIPKNLPFNFPSQQVQAYMKDEGAFYSYSFYFRDPSTVCQSVKSTFGDRLVVQGQTAEMKIPLTEIEAIAEAKWTKGFCFNTMGVHYWRDVRGVPIAADMDKDNFFPMFLLYNKGKLNGFGFALNTYIESPRVEHPTADVINRFINPTPSFLSNPTQSDKLTTLHIYLDSTPLLNYC